MEDVCPHRRAPLSTGKVVFSSHRNREEGDDGISLSSSSSTITNNTIMCRFHGWEFDSAGACTKIPMQSPETISDATHTKVTQAVTFPSQVKGGLLWAFMDENVAPSDLPELSPEAYIEGDASQMQFIVNVFPVSYMSMIENSFDPSHAPFVHEGVSEFGGRVYSPDDAVPMERYGFKEGTTSTSEGFILEHTPYMAGPSDAAMQQSTTTRQFVSPCSQITKSTYFGAYLYFIPSTPRETLVFFGFSSFASKPASGVKNAMLSIVPKSFKSKISNMVKDAGHFARENSEKQRRFTAQDTLTMQGQDYNKQYTTSADGIGHEGVVLDVVPTPADNGVSIFQRWVKRYAGHGPFGGMSSRSSTRSNNGNGRDVAYQPTQSQWDAHAKYCPICQRTLKRMSKWANVSQRVSLGLVGACTLLHIVSYVYLKSPSKVNVVSRLLYGGLLTAAMLQWTAAQMRSKVESNFVSHAHAHHPKNNLLMEPYAK
jgi:phenylpropionate dioxygenase-like ring-hydroxylating dioxygenase large terminal subunit